MFIFPKIFTSPIIVPHQCSPLNMSLGWRGWEDQDNAFCQVKAKQLAPTAAGTGEGPKEQRPFLTCKEEDQDSAVASLS